MHVHTCTHREPQKLSFWLLVNDKFPTTACALQPWQQQMQQHAPPDGQPHDCEHTSPELAVLPLPGGEDQQGASANSNTNPRSEPLFTLQPLLPVDISTPKLGQKVGDLERGEPFVESSPCNSSTEGKPTGLTSALSPRSSPYGLVRISLYFVGVGAAFWHSKQLMEGGSMLPVHYPNRQDLSQKEDLINVFPGSPIPWV
eukprot:scaffold116052_cov17-Tisochrysis_lutea.AAC.4